MLSKELLTVYFNGLHIKQKIYHIVLKCYIQNFRGFCILRRNYSRFCVLFHNMFWEFTRCDQVVVLLSGFPELTRNSPDIWFSGSKFRGSESSNWAEMNSLNITDGVHGQKFFKHPTGADFITHRLTDARLDTDSSVQDVVTCGNRLITDKDSQTLTAASQGVVQVCFVQSTAFTYLLLIPI